MTSYVCLKFCYPASVFDNHLLTCLEAVLCDPVDCRKATPEDPGRSHYLLFRPSYEVV